MKIKKAIYVETIEILVLGASRWRKHGLEADLEDGDNAVECLVELKKKVDEIQKINNMDMDVFAPPIPTIKSNPVVERIKILIDSATSKKELDGYRLSCPKEILPYLETKYVKLKK